MTKELEPGSRILIAEDDLVSRRMLQVFLAKWGYEVVVARDGREALQTLEAEGAPSLAILDWMMPGLEGPEVCQRVRHHPGRRYTYILLLTARTQKGDLLRGLESGADDYLTKPFDAQELRARLLVGRRILELQESLITVREELLFQATHDGLTGIANRAVALEAIARERALQARKGGTFGVVLLDLDHFKNINDSYGHLCGDAVLKEAARRIAGCVRPYDTVGRYGGEEFLVVVPFADGAGTLAMAERIRHTIGSEPFQSDAGPIRVTISCGVATSEKALDQNALLHLADVALYRAKERGRNRCEAAISTDEPSPAPPVDSSLKPVSQ